MDHKLAMATISMGWHKSHTFEAKLDAAKKHDIQGIELVDKDLNKRPSHDDGFASFDDFEGQPSPLESRLDKAREWCKVAFRAGTDLIQIPSNFDPEAIGDEAVIVQELQALADLGSQCQPPIRFAYESLAWGKYAADWEESLRIVELVNRPNLGLRLDTYHVLARLWADPMTPSGRRPGGDVVLRDSLQRFRDTCPPEKIFYVQLSDAQKLNPLLLPDHPAYKEDQPVLYSWCLYGRICPFEKEYGAYLLMDEIILAWSVDIGWSGWVSMETFHHSMTEEKATPGTWAGRAKTSWERVQGLLQ